MRLLFEEITGKVHRYTINDSCWFPHENGDFSLAATANISVSRRDSETVLLKGELEGRRSAACDRCGEQVTDSIHSEFVYLVTIRKEQALELGDIECSDEDTITLYLKEPEIDVDEILREQAYLAVPLKTLCSEDCKGICAGCGALLNSQVCCCSVDTPSSTFAVLKKLTNR
jgi:uncharacterized protein